MVINVVNPQNQPAGSFVRPQPFAFANSMVAPGDVDLYSAIRKIGLIFALCIIFDRYSLAHELLTVLTGTKTPILYLLTVPTLIAIIGAHGFQRAFSCRTSKYWLAFAVWMVITVPFSTWRGESFRYALDYFKAELPMIVFISGLAITWKETRMILYAIGLAGVANVTFSRVFSTTYSGRNGLEFGTMANPNDYAAVLVMCLPIILFVALRPMQIFPPLRILVQLAAVIAIGYGAYKMLASGSRGALVAIAAAMVFLFIKSTMRIRVAMLVVVPFAAAFILAALPANTIERLKSFTAQARSIDDGDAQSAFMRKRLLMASIADTFTHPIFGLGPGQFPNYEGRDKSHDQGGFQGTHNSFTAISCETGLPGLFFYVAGVFSSFFLMNRTLKLAKKFEAKEMVTACLCVMTSFVGFCVAVFFLNFGYFFYLPGFAGLAIAMWNSVKRETELMSAPQQQYVPPAPVFQARRRTPAWEADVASSLSSPAALPRNRYSPGPYRPR